MIDIIGRSAEALYGFLLAGLPVAVAILVIPKIWRAKTKKERLLWGGQLLFSIGAAGSGYMVVKQYFLWG